MISLTIKDTKSFMSHLLIKDTFDQFLLSEAVISTANTYTVNGSINKDFFSADELEDLGNSTYSAWNTVKPFCFSLIKGNKVPVGMKIIFLLPDYLTDELLEKSQTEYNINNINGLFLNIKYANGAVTIVMGTSLNIFSLDKTLENTFDSYVRHFFEDAGISYEEM